MKKIQADEAERRALTLFDEWNDTTGFVDPSSGYCGELQGLIEDAVHIGIQMAMFGKIIKNDDDEIARDYTEPKSEEIVSSKPKKFSNLIMNGTNGLVAAFKTDNGVWVIKDAEAALDQLLEQLKPNYNGPA